MIITHTRATWSAPLLNLRRRVLTPSRQEVDLAARGFELPAPIIRSSLERAGNSFLDGYEIAAGSARSEDVVEALERLTEANRGFAYEGAGMALAILDAIPGLHRHHISDLLAGAGDRHSYMVHVGAGWALARLPRLMWRAATAGLTDPLLRWLALDGYGFHQAYFKTRDYVHGTRDELDFPWPADDATRYAHHAIDQGVGRATWFVEGADPTRVARRIETFADRRRGDLYAGVGLAATYAGGADADQLRELLHMAGPHALDISQGSTFAAEARRRAGNLETHTDLATRVLVGVDAEEAADIAVQCKPESKGGSKHVPAYETWRHNIIERVSSVRGVA